MSLHLAVATRVFLVLPIAAFSALSHAADGTIRIRGAVVEPVCSISTTAFGVGMDALQRLSRTRSSSAMPLELNMRCNARQAIQLTMTQPAKKIRAEFETGIEGVRMQLRHEGRVVTPGKALSISLPQRTEYQIRMETRLEADIAEAQKGKLPDVTTGPAQMQDPGRMLIAIDYL
ncbi:hypothetical protein [Herbaspirillum sp. alder98]|uniref:hypothetical protein n=1 Tax=Herbaspirillum sp. alder98 TaxID=2913096 RepID=UPI001CD88332|nr:hypothetical protein [Herbaspirillum sp. alder98]MCA1324596.1 hypothetical protein [Herbaspirillum sp. alder98]